MRISKQRSAQSVKQRFFALAEGIYPVLLLDAVDCYVPDPSAPDQTMPVTSYHDVKWDDEKQELIVTDPTATHKWDKRAKKFISTPIEGAPTHDWLERTPMLVCIAMITAGRHVDRKTVYRFPLQGYAKPDGINDDEMTAQGYTVENNYWVDEHGYRVESENGTAQCDQNVNDMFAAILPDGEGDIADVEAMADDERLFNLLIKIDRYGTKSYNRWARFFTYNEDAVSDDDEKSETLKPKANVAATEVEY